MVQKGFSIPFGTLKDVQIFSPFSVDHPLLTVVPVDALHIYKHISILLIVFLDDS